MPFYTWASVIVDGRVVATDYAPDSGWLLATPGAAPEAIHVPMRFPFELVELPVDRLDDPVGSTAIPSR